MQTYEAMTSNLIISEKQRETRRREEGRLCDQRGRDWSDAATGRNKTKNKNKHHLPAAKPGEARRIHPSSLQKELYAEDTSISAPCN